MTRINVGIPPNTLHRKHLVAEYRELPRVIGARIKRPAPSRFCLGPGHVAWCAQYQGSLVARYRELVAEMRRRGYHVSHPEPKAPANHATWSAEDEAYAAPIVAQRIAERLS